MQHHDSVAFNAFFGHKIITKSPLSRPPFILAHPLKFLEQFLLSSIQVRRDGHRRFDHLIAPAVSPEANNPLALQTEEAARLRPRRNFQLFHARQGRHLYGGPQGRLNEGDGDAAEDVVSVSFKNIILNARQTISIIRQ